MRNGLRLMGGLFWGGYEWLAMLAGWLFLGLLCLFWLPFAMVLYPLLPRRAGQSLGRYMIMLGFRLYLWFLQRFCAIHFDLTELDSLPKDRGQILVANHPSLLDAVLVVSRLHNAVCVMKASLMDNILLGAAARLARYIRNDVPLNMLLRARSELGEQASVLIFPEGSRTSVFPLDRLSQSAALLSRQSGVALQTLLIDFDYAYLGKDWPVYRKPRLPLRVKVRVGRRFAVPSDVMAATQELQNYLRAELAATMMK